MLGREAEAAAEDCARLEFNRVAAQGAIQGCLKVASRVDEDRGSRRWRVGHGTGYG